MSKEVAEYSNISQIEKDTGKKFLVLYNELLSQGLSQTEIAIKLNLKGSSVIASYLNFKNSTAAIKNAPISELRKVLNENNVANHRPSIEKKFPELFNIEYKDFLYQKYITEKQSPVELAQLLGFSKNAIQSHLKVYNIKKNKSQARMDAIEKGTINYSKILSKARKTMKSSKHGSHSQGLIHSLVQEGLTSELIENEIHNVEVIVGLNEWGILIHKEVDIPIICIHNDTNSFRKYSIEFQGEHWHNESAQDSRDKDKTVKLNEHGWKHFEILSGSFEDMNNSVRDIISEIIGDLMNKEITY